MKVNLNVTLKHLKPQSQDKETIGEIVASVLVTEKNGDPFKYYEWAQKLYAGESIELDRSDFETLKNFIKNSDRFIVLIKAQALLLMGEFKQNTK